MNFDRNVVLIGMPGAGKSTVGVILAKCMSLDFIDTDVLIQLREGCTLQEIVDTRGHAALRIIEEKVIVDLHARRSVIATGGSAVYSGKAMKHLKKSGVAVFLEVTEKTILSRVNDFGTRGLAKRQDQTFSELFAERFPLYRRYADHTVTCDSLTHEETCRHITEKLFNHEAKRRK